MRMASAIYFAFLISFKVFGFFVFRKKIRKEEVYEKSFVSSFKFVLVF